MILAIDFDGVVHDHKHPIEGRRMGAPIEGAKEALQIFKRRGDRVIIFSVWGDAVRQKVIADWLKFYAIPHDSITNIKPMADVYIDDKAIRFTSWLDIQSRKLI